MYTDVEGIVETVFERVPVKSVATEQVPDCEFSWKTFVHH